ncbi:FAD/NAD(P)-binding domain-containing protein [Laetiporus sulphureus 93-53]|uniref:FAD/NAD(P)-binding domain-containing protein n=1 Tax=Laetiporus sulphureus 93-53 TaxID=1314785 RepID=A0A165IKK1_9APHY|nr:FAD/NAD(P)-binding domain-containing protein [Laetiporus sulphureus 93-53]KZT13206.1 FAD/NAD(P)-binding domain-containing protein [Laetiporus sulphureus 93-53]
MDVDVVVLGTGLTESITAAALSKAGFKVAHIDANPYYGGDDASLTLDELIDWADRHTSQPDALDNAYTSAQRARFASITHSSSSLPQSRQYSLSLAPSIIPSIGPLIDALVASGVSRYGGFKLLEKVALYAAPGKVRHVPGSKEDVFKSKELSLLDKRRLMRFLTFAAGEFEGSKELEGKVDVPFFGFLRETFSLEDRTAGAIAYALAFCNSALDPTLPALQRIRRYLRSTGRYGPSPFLLGHYGGLGEIAQGFCRTSAVNGATYILGRQIASLDKKVSDEVITSSSGQRHKVELHDLEEKLICDVVVSPLDYLPSDIDATTVPSLGPTPTYPVARCIAIIDRPLSFTTPDATTENPSEPISDDGADSSREREKAEEMAEEAKEEVDTALLVFPPSTLPENSGEVAVNVLITGEGSMSAPRGKWILYITMPLLDASTATPDELLSPYLDATLSLATPPPGDGAPVQALFTLFYIQHPPSQPAQKLEAAANATVLVTPTCSPVLPEQGDLATVNAESVFFKTVEMLKACGRCPRRKEGDEVVSGDVWEIESFWPPLDIVDDPSEDW